MKLYKLRFTQNDFADQSPNIWRTEVIDLYDNNQYVNYSTLKNSNGTNLLGDGTYTGLNQVSATSSEIGYVVDGRFVDTSGIANLIAWKMTGIDRAAEAEVLPLLNVYLSDDSNSEPYYESATPDLVNDWEVKTGIRQGDPIYSLNSKRYVFFEIVFSSELQVDPSNSFELIVNVEISGPVVNGFFSGTRRALDRFPEWMEMREYDPLDLTDSNKATPESLGGQFINAVAGEWVTDLRNQVTYNQFNKFIENVDMTQKDWVWRVVNLPDDVFSVTYVDNTLATPIDKQLSLTADVGEFYRLNGSENAYFYNPIKAELFTLQEYPVGELKVNGEPVTQERYHVWNSLDDIGITADLFRLPGEGNDSFRKRILDVYISKPGVSEEKFKLALRRELNLWKYFGATPDSFYLGATPEVLTVEDIEQSDLYFDERGNAKEKFYNLVRDLGREYPMTWGLFEFGKALWDPSGLQKKGFGTIPKQFDVEPATPYQYQSGVGDINDMYLLRPDFYQPEHEFDVTLAVRGRTPSIVSRYTEIPMEVTVEGIANATIATYDPVPRSFHLEIIHSDTNTYVANFMFDSGYFGGDPGAINLQDYSPGTTWPPPVTDPGAKPTFDWYDVDGTTSDFLIWYDKSDGSNYFSTDIDLTDITNVKVRPGYFDNQDLGIKDVPDSDYYRLKFTDSSLTSNLGYTGSLFIEEASPSFIESATPAVVAEDLSLEYEAWDFAVSEDDVDGYSSTPQLINFSINENDILSSSTISVSNFSWPAYNGTGVEVHKIKITLSDQDSDGLYGTYTRDGIFIDATDITVNGSNAWVNGVLTLTLGATLSAGEAQVLEFSCNSSTGYPNDVQVWDSIYSKQLVPLDNQKVNEHGPYRDGRPPQLGNRNYRLASFEFDRSDFNLTEDEVLTWIGIDSVSDPDVLVWLDTNSIVPIGEDEGNYPVSALKEFDNGGSKTLSIINVYARLKENLNPTWNPFVHSGWFYEDSQDYYMYADAQSATISGLQEITLEEGAHLGAPIIVESESGTPFRHVPFSSNDHTVTERVDGTGTVSLFASYTDIYDITVRDLTLDQVVSIAASVTTSNEITTVDDTPKDHSYEISYKPRFSFYSIENGTPGQVDLKFSEAAPVSDPYIVNWESSKFNPATPIEIPLHPVYSSFPNAFIYLDHDEKDVKFVEVYISNSILLATPGDYAMATLSAYDQFGNPKPNATFSVSVTGTITLSENQVTTDDEGKAVFYLDSDIGATSGSVDVQSLDGSATPASTSSSYEVRPLVESKGKIQAVMDTNELLADGSAGNTLFGRAFDGNGQPISGQTVYWRKSRDLSSLFNTVSQSSDTATPGSSLDAGAVTTDAEGRFSVGPFISQLEPGYWLVSVETGDIGDVTYWYEYLNVTNTLDPVSLQPFYSVQAATPAYFYEDFYSTPAYPVTLDIEDYIGAPSGATPNWLPPTWYPVARYEQYQMGLLGSQHYEIDNSATPYFEDQVES